MAADDELFAVWRGMREREGSGVTLIELSSRLGPLACRVEHVGSTSVPGLAAKPVVDIQVSMADIADEDRYRPPCEAAGLQLHFRDLEHRFFQPPPERPRVVHVHVCQRGGGWERAHLLFRDYLRASAGVRETYAAAKHEAAELWADQRAAYTEAKTGVILGILSQAEAWAGASGWMA